MPNFEKPPTPDKELSLDEELGKAVEEQKPAETEPILNSKTEPKLPEPPEKEIEEPPELAEQETEEPEEKQGKLKTLLTRLEELTQKKDKTKEEIEKHRELIGEVRELADNIAKTDIEEEARKKHEQDKGDENYKKRVENTAVKKAEDERFQAKCVDKLLSPLFEKENGLIEKEKKYYNKYGKFLFGQARYSPAEAAGLFAGGFTAEQIRSIKWPIWGKIKIPNPVGEGEIFLKESELESYANEGLVKHITEEAQKETDEQIVRSINLEMIRNVAETGNTEGKKEQSETPPDSDEEAESKKLEKKPEISQEVKDLMQEKLNEEINRLTAEFYDSYINGKLKKDGKPAEISDEERTDFILQRIKVDSGKNPKAAETRKKLAQLIAIRGGLKEEETRPEANYSALNYFWKKANESKENIPESERTGYKKSSDAESDKFYWEENSKIVRELANNISGKDLKEESKKELSEFLKKPETAEQFEKEQEEYIEKQKQERTERKFNSVFPADIADQINETGKLKIGKVTLDKEEIIGLVCSGCKAEDIMAAKPLFWSDKIKIGGRQFSKSELDEIKNKTNSVIENIFKKEFEKKWEIRALRTIEENKIKELLKE